MVAAETSAEPAPAAERLWKTRTRRQQGAASMLGVDLSMTPGAKGEGGEAKVGGEEEDSDESFTTTRQEEDGS